MLEIKNVTKNFGEKKALNSLSFNIPTGSIFGLIGSNGSGKSTLLRVISGVYEPDGGSVEIDGVSTYENPKVKAQCFFISDFPYFYNNSTVANLSVLYKSMYPSWSDDKFRKLACMFPININDRIINMSKGMQRQAALILALSTCPRYIFLDEIFDGLDPVVRHLLKRILIEHVAEHQMTVIIASHNLRELEDLCDRICLMHRGSILMERDIDSLRLEFRKVQVAFREVPNVPNLFEGINAVSIWRNGNVFNVTIRGTEEEFMPKLNALQPAYISAMPLTLEEIFISEMGAAGYDTNSIV